MRMEEVTAEWLQHALSARWPGIAVRGVTRDHFSHGAATRARLSVECAWQGAGDAPPRTMWLKTGFEAHHDFAMPNYSVEVDFYRTIRAALPIRSPSSYFAMVQDQPPQATILLEDLTSRNVVFGSATKPMTLDQAASGLDQLAILHSQPLATPQLARLKPITAVRYATEERGTRSERYFQWTRAFAAPVVLHDAERIRRGFDIYWKMIFGGPACLLHGDAHVGNSYIEPGDAVSFLDWQGYGTGYWIHDVPYFLIGALDLPDRRSSERDLLKHYLGRRQQLGAKMPAFEQVWADYRRAVLFGFITWLGNEDTWQRPEVNLAQFARFSVAMIDHDVFKLLGV
jgi:aminoglycoside phosphotransferase (APT) family kinase protein